MGTSLPQRRGQPRAFQAAASPRSTATRRLVHCAALKRGHLLPPIWSRQRQAAPRRRRGCGRPDAGRHVDPR
eukprot:4879078-Alexandrium_andersonii.AAC.1